MAVMGAALPLSAASAMPMHVAALTTVSTTHDPTVKPAQETWTWDESQQNPEGTANPTLQYVAEDNSSALAQAFMSFQLPPGTTAADLVSVVLSYPEDTSSQDGYFVASNPDPGTAPDASSVQLDACPVTKAWTAKSVPPGSPQSGGPSYDCNSAIAPGNLMKTSSGPAWTFDLTAIASMWASGSPDDGIAVEAPSGLGTWSVPLEGTKASISITLAAESSPPASSNTATGTGATAPVATSPPAADGSAAGGGTTPSGLTTGFPGGLPGTGTASIPPASGSAPLVAPPTSTTRQPTAASPATAAPAASTTPAGIPAPLWLAILLVLGLLVRTGRLVFANLRPAHLGAPIGGSTR
jgi:hypothetical protein